MENEIVEHPDEDQFAFDDDAGDYRVSEEHGREQEEDGHFLDHLDF